MTPLLRRLGAASAIALLVTACQDDTRPFSSPVVAPSRDAEGAGPALLRTPLSTGPAAASPAGASGSAARVAGPGAAPSPITLAPGVGAVASAGPAQAATVTAAATSGAISRMLWQNTSNGEYGLWTMAGTTYQGDWSSLYTGYIPAPWSVVATADFTGDGTPDLVWQNTGTGEVGFWPMTGATWSGQYIGLAAVPAQWRVAAAGDFTGDGKADLVWQNITTGERGLWEMNGTAFTGTYRLLYPQLVPTQWDIAAAADMSGDGKADLVWQNTATGERGVWVMNNYTYASYAPLYTDVVPTPWDIAAVTDLTGDGNADVVWQNTQTGERGAWVMNGTTFTGTYVLLYQGTVPTNWNIAAVLPDTRLNLAVDAVYATQSIQNYQGTVPLVAGRQALVRVFTRASKANAATPVVRVVARVGGVVQQTADVTASAASVPTTIDQGVLAQSWNVVLPAGVVQPGLTLTVTVDPANAVDEWNEGDNGATVAVAVQSVPPLAITMVPITFSLNPALAGNVTEGNKDQFFTTTKLIHPLGTVDVALRAGYTTALPVLDANDVNGSWGTLLSEIWALRTADASNRMYYGVMKVTYNSGIAGLGYIGWPAAIGWDYLPSGHQVLAHEIGHNWGRDHAPGCGAGSPDAGYPFADGTIGIYGWNATTNAVIPPTWTDIMGYCGNQWISEYTYRAVLAFRAANPFVGTTSQPAVASEPTLMVWGTIRGGEIALEPSFDITTRPVVPSGTGSYRLRALDASGRELYGANFEPASVGEASVPVRAFSFAIPMSDAVRSQVARIDVVGPAGRRATAIAAAAAGADPAITVTRTASDRAVVKWNAAAHPMVLVRDPVTGEILSFARGGQTTVRTARGELELHVSNRVHSAARRVRVE
ncbi:MAG TPA: FG-GAP-like repeat-containing protein [Gemmatimonadaceae bacterium]